MATTGHTYQRFIIAGNARVQLGDINQSEPTSERVLAWLSASNTEVDHASAFERYYYGTLDWVFVHLAVREKRIETELRYDRARFPSGKQICWSCVRDKIRGCLNND